MCAKFHCPSSTVTLFSGRGWNPPPLPVIESHKKPSLNRVKLCVLKTWDGRYDSKMCLTYVWDELISAQYLMESGCSNPRPIQSLFTRM